MGDDNNIEIIRGYVFNKCSSLNEDLVFPKCTGSFNEMAFNGSGIKSISAPLVTSIGNRVINNANGVFGLCKNLTRVYLPSVTSIGTFAFYGCTSLKEIAFGDLTIIDTYAFYNCTSLEFEELNLPNLEILGQNAFYGVKIKKISNLGKLTTLPTATSNTQNFGDKNSLEELILPEGILTIGEHVFSNYVSLKKIAIPDSVYKIEQYAFTSCQVESISANGVTTLVDAYSADSKRGVFYNCTNLKHINMPNLTYIGHCAFTGCTSLEIEDFNFPELTHYGQNALYGVKITRISNLGKITALNYTRNGTGYEQFGNKTTLKSVILPDTLTDIYPNSFAGYNNLEYVICQAIVPPSGLNSTEMGTSLNYPIYVPDASVTAYREASGWSAYADRIRPLSEYVEE